MCKSICIGRRNMLMSNLQRLLFFFAALFFLTFYFLMFVKIMAYRDALKEDSIWSVDGKCELVTYRPDYRNYGGIGRLLKMFSNQSFFVVYDNKGRKLKGSEWYFWEYQFSDEIAPEWHGQYALYPTSSGWEGWKIPECK